MGMILMLPGLQSIRSRKLQRRVNTIDEFLVGERLGEVADGPGFQRLGACTIVSEGRYEDNRYPTTCDEALLQFEYDMRRAAGKNEETRQHENAGWRLPSMQTPARHTRRYRIRHCRRGRLAIDTKSSSAHLRGAAH